MSMNDLELVKLMQSTQVIIDLYETIMTDDTIESQFQSIVSERPFQLREKEIAALNFYTGKILEDSEAGRYQIGGAVADEMIKHKPQSQLSQILKDPIDLIKNTVGNEECKDLIYGITKDFILKYRSLILANGSSLSFLVPYDTLLGVILECMVYRDLVIMPELRKEMDNKFGEGFTQKVQDQIQSFKESNK